MRILVTGAGGFVGGALVDSLQRADGCEVVALSRSAAPDDLAFGAKWLRCDLRSEIPLAEGVDYIIHCAALRNSCGLPVKDFIEGNLAMTEQVAAYGRKVGIKGLIFASSLSVHGHIGSGVVDEHTDIVNPSPYGISKHLCELVLQEQSRYFPVISMRLCGVVGKGAHEVWLAGVLQSALRGESIEIHNAGSLFNNILHTDDLCGFVYNAMKSGFTGCNALPLASCKPMTIRDVVAAIIAETGSSSAIVDAGVAGNPFLICNESAISRFNYTPVAVATNLVKFSRSV